MCSGANQATVVKTRAPSKVDGRPSKKSEPAKSDQAKDESDEFESLLSCIFIFVFALETSPYSILYS